MTTTMNFQQFDNNQRLVGELCQRISGLLNQAIEANGIASLVVSGGRSPIALFKALREQPLNWSKVVVSLADERWVAADNDASNAKLVREHLLQGAAAAADFIALAGNEPSPQEGMAAALARFAPLADGCDVLILGMGEDGHTASIFPCSAEVDRALDLDYPDPLIAVQPQTAPNARISLTLATLLKSRQIFLPLNGAAKFSVYQQAVDGDDQQQMPIRAILQQTKAPLDVLYSEQ